VRRCCHHGSWSRRRSSPSSPSCGNSRSLWISGGGRYPITVCILGLGRTNCSQVQAWHGRGRWQARSRQWPNTVDNDTATGGLAASLAHGRAAPSSIAARGGKQPANSCTYHAAWLRVSRSLLQQSSSDALTTRPRAVIILIFSSCWRWTHSLTTRCQDLCCSGTMPLQLRVSRMCLECSTSQPHSSQHVGLGRRQVIFLHQMLQSKESLELNVTVGCPTLKKPTSCRHSIFTAESSCTFRKTLACQCYDAAGLHSHC